MVVRWVDWFPSELSVMAVPDVQVTCSRCQCENTDLYAFVTVDTDADGHPEPFEVVGFGWDPEDPEQQIEEAITSDKRRALLERAREILDYQDEIDVDGFAVYLESIGA